MIKLYHITDKNLVSSLKHGDLVVMADGEVKQVTKCLSAVFFGHCPTWLQDEARTAYVWAVAGGLCFVGIVGFVKDDTGSTGKVFWSKEHGSWDVTGVEFVDGFGDFVRWDCQVSDISQDCKVIGNIYEKPELLTNLQ